MLNTWRRMQVLGPDLVCVGEAPSSGRRQKPRAKASGGGPQDEEVPESVDTKCYSF